MSVAPLELPLEVTPTHTLRLLPLPADPPTGPLVSPPADATVVRQRTPRRRKASAITAIDDTPNADDDSDEVDQWVARFVTASLEVALGMRNPAQLVRWTSPKVHEWLCRRHQLSRMRRSTHRAPAVRLRSVRTTRLGPHTIEACAVVQIAGRGKAVALRLDTSADQWRVVALEIG